MDSGAIACRGQRSILNLAHEDAMLRVCDFLDLLPLLVALELVPGVSHRLFIGPGEQIDELCPVSQPCLPHPEDVEPVGSHDSPGVVAEPVVKRFLVLVENLIDPKLMNHVSHISMISHDGRSFFCYDMEASSSIGEESQVKFSIELPVQFRDIDVMGHVNNATYLQYMETARVELARRFGQVTDGIRPDFIVASARCEFKKPIRDERRITVSVWVSRIRDHAWDLDYSIHGLRGVEYAIGRTTQVAYDYKTGSAVPNSPRGKREIKKRLRKPVKFREI